MDRLTDRQASILDFIENYIDSNGIPPTRREIAEAFSFSKNAADSALILLEKKGFIALGREARSIVLSSSERRRRENRKIPLYSSEPSPLSIGKDTGSFCYIDKQTLPSGGFAFIVTSESMRNAGIIPGDIAIMDDRTDSISDGDIILSSYSEEDDRMELRRYRMIRQFHELWPENDAMGIIKTSRLRVFGVLKAIRRDY